MSDPGNYRTKEELDAKKDEDPILRLKAYILEHKLADQSMHWMLLTIKLRQKSWNLLSLLRIAHFQIWIRYTKISIPRKIILSLPSRTY